MSEAGERFTRALGRPDPPSERGPLCNDPRAAAALAALRAEVGGGWFRDRFLYLFGEELDTLKPCLDAWSFLVRGGSAGCDFGDDGRSGVWGVFVPWESACEHAAH